ncbi:hypothetical protein [Campylobacter sp.]|uniref:hypothetical protein n=1 Tax=Campylobacter sp. TaxID=205 RepID=UPI0025BC7FEC|nr:hypothetical protein [Campylobacter sp.]
MKKIIILCILISVVFSSNNYDTKEQEYQQLIQAYNNTMDNYMRSLTSNEYQGTYTTGFGSAFVCGIINFIQSVANMFYFGDNPKGWNFDRYFKDDYRPHYYLEGGVGTDWDKFSFVGALEYLVYKLAFLLMILMIYLVYKLLLKLQVKDSD